jgi:hypothetical protein
VFGRVRDGYVALFSTVPVAWEHPTDPFCHDLVAKGTRNAWICMLGNMQGHGTFEAFMEEVARARKSCDIDALNVSFDAPRLGTVEVSWADPMRVDGKAIPVRDYSRLSNQFCESAFGSGRYVVHGVASNLLLDYDAITRDEED